MVYFDRGVGGLPQKFISTFFLPSFFQYSKFVLILLSSV